MATAVQTKRLPSVAEEKVSAQLSVQNPDEDCDQRLLHLLEVCQTEQEERDKEGREREWCFWVMATARANWAIEQCVRIPVGKYPRTRKRLAILIADGFLSTKEMGAESRFAHALLKWEKEDEKIPSDSLREMMKFRWEGTSVTQKEKTQKVYALLSYLTGTPLKMNEEVVRAIFKAIGVYLEIRQLRLLADKVSVMM